MELIKVLGLLAPLIFALALPSASAQTIPPVDDTVDQVEETVDQVQDAADQVVETVEGTVNQAAQTTQDAAGAVTGGGGGAQGSTGGAVAGAGDVGGAVLSGSGSGSGSATHTGGEVESREAARPGGDARGDRTRARAKGDPDRPTAPASVVARPLTLADGLAAAPVVVIKTNDADGDGSFNRNEIAAETGTDVPFRIVIRNIGSQPATLLGVSDYLPGGGEVSERRDVCMDLAGTSIEPGATVACTFTLPAYAPPQGEVKVNTAAANVVLSDGMVGPGAIRSLYATSSVQTGQPEVLGIVLPNPGELARTGAVVLPLVAAAVVLATLGAKLLRTGRRMGFDPPDGGRLRYR
jgi:uncharacterized repeat protein (TIGR01451 family)